MIGWSALLAGWKEGLKAIQSKRALQAWEEFDMY